MITQWLVHLGTTIAGWVGGLMPQWDVPAAIADPGSLVTTIFANFVGLGSWVSWPVLIACSTAVLGTWLAMFLAKLVRAIVSYLPFFGGAG